MSFVSLLPRAAPWQRSVHLLAAMATAWALTACALPTPPSVKAVYDFGPASATTRIDSPETSTPLALADVEASPAFDGTAVQYRLAYVNAQELRPYTRARWSMAPSLLVQQRVRMALEKQGPVLAPGEGSAAYSLKLELEEFSQQFDAPQSSQGVVQLRATLFKGATLAAQRNFSASAPASTADAAGGVHALSTATDAAAAQLAAWVTDRMR